MDADLGELTVNTCTCREKGRAAGIPTSASFFELTAPYPWAPVSLNLKSLIQGRLILAAR